jgi:hypothetical protein
VPSGRLARDLARFRIQNVPMMMVIH